MDAFEIFVVEMEKQAEYARTHPRVSREVHHTLAVVALTARTAADMARVANQDD